MHVIRTCDVDTLVLTEASLNLSKGTPNTIDVSSTNDFCCLCLFSDNKVSTGYARIVLNWWRREGERSDRYFITYLSLQNNVVGGVLSLLLDKQ